MKPIGIDIFAGAGGLSLGAQWAGIEVKTAIELNNSAVATYRHNHPEANVIDKDIQEVDASQFKDKSVFIIMGGAPCQGFSMSNTMSRNLDNPKNFLFKEFVRFVRDIKPKWFESLLYTKLAKDATKYEKLMRNGSRKSKQNYVSKNNDLVIQCNHL